MPALLAAEARAATPLPLREKVVTANRVEKVFAGGVVAVEGASFSIEAGQFVSILGPSGCGKSTLLRMIAGLVDKTSGGLNAFGTEIEGPRPDIGMMFQRPTLLPWKTALENVLLPKKLAGKVSPAHLRAAMDLLSLVGLQGFEHAYPQHLSGGMQQRVALARLLNIGAGVLLLDEPFGALDEFTRERLNLELMRIQREVDATIVFVTHNITEAVFMADKVMVMTPRPGRLAAEITVPFEHPRKIELLKSPEFNELLFNVRAVLGGH